MLPSVWLITPETPSLPLPPLPTGHAMSLPTLLSEPPRVCAQGGLSLVRKSDHTAVVPEPSERWATAIGWSGRFAPEFSATSAGSFHLVILPAKILPSVSPSNFRPVWTPLTL